MYVPSTITTEDGVQYPVKSVGTYAFAGNPWLVAVYFAEGIEEILSGSMERCPLLETVSLPSTLKTFYGGFEGSTKIQKLVLNQGLETLSIHFIYGANIIGKSVIPASVRNVIESINRCTGLQFTGYDVDPANPYFKSDNGVWLSKDGTVLYGVPMNLESWGVTEYTVPSTVTRVAPGVFYYSLLSKITLQEGVVDATNSITTLERCTVLNLPSTLQSNPFSLYAYAPKLQQINVATGSRYFVTEDGILYTSDKSEVLHVPAGRDYDTLEFPDTTTIVGARAMNAVAVNHFKFGKNVRILRDRAINSCGDIRNLGVESVCEIPASLTDVMVDAVLMDCKFDQYTVDSANPELMIQNHMLLSKDGTKLYAILLSNGLYIDTLVVPSTVNYVNTRVLTNGNQCVRVIDYSQTKITELRSYTCGGHPTLQGFQVKLPNTLVIIQGGAVIYSDNLEELDIPASVTTIAPVSIYTKNLKTITFRNPGQFTANSIFGMISQQCVVRGYRGSTAEDVARQYTLRFEPLD